MVIRASVSGWRLVFRTIFIPRNLRNLFTIRAERKELIMTSWYSRVGVPIYGIIVYSWIGREFEDDLYDETTTRIFF